MGGCDDSGHKAKGSGGGGRRKVMRGERGEEVMRRSGVEGVIV